MQYEQQNHNRKRPEAFIFNKKDDAALTTLKQLFNDYLDEYRRHRGARGGVLTMNFFNTHGMKEKGWYIYEIGTNKLDTQDLVDFLVAKFDVTNSDIRFCTSVNEAGDTLQYVKFKVSAFDARFSGNSRESDLANTRAQQHITCCGGVKNCIFPFFKMCVWMLFVVVLGNVIVGIKK